MSFEQPTQRELNLQERYVALVHAMQSGVKFDQESGSQCGTPKHLRTGINKAMVEHGALCGLLEKAGVITAEDYWEAVNENMAREVKKYEALLAKKLRAPVTLQ